MFIKRSYTEVTEKTQRYTDLPAVYLAQTGRQGRTFSRIRDKS
jgi:hypothetical protein